MFIKRNISKPAKFKEQNVAAVDAEFGRPTN